MAQILEFRMAREAAPAVAAEPRCRCARCGAELWHIGHNGEVSCADCEAVCPYRLQMKNEA